MSGPLVPQVHTAEVRAAHARQNAIEANFNRMQAKRHAERIRELAQRARRRLDSRVESGAETRQ